MMSKREFDDNKPLGKRFDAREDVRSAEEFRRRAEVLGFSSEEIDRLLRFYGPQYPLDPR